MLWISAPIHTIAYRMKLGLKIAFGLGAVVLSATGVPTYEALHSVGILDQRLESLNKEAILPFALAQKINDSLDKMQTSLISAINETGSQQQKDLNEVTALEQEFSTSLVKYEKESMITTHPVMQDLLKKYAALEDQLTREQDAIKEVNQDYPLLKSLNHRIVELVKNGKREEANHLFNNTANEIYDQLDVNTKAFMRLQVEQGSYSSREGQAVFRATQKQIGFAVAVTILFGFIAVLGLTRILVRPLQELTLATQ